VLNFDDKSKSAVKKFLHAFLHGQFLSGNTRCHSEEVLLMWTEGIKNKL